MGSDMMASPQLENGYTKISNELLDAICKLNLSGNEFKILFFIIRQTYGYNHKEHELALSFISKAVNILPPHVSRALKKMSDLNVITIQAAHGIKPQIISLQKDYSKWVLPKTVTVTKNGNSSITKNGNSSITKNGNQRKKESKERINKDILLIPSFFDDLWQAYPNKKGRNKISKKAYKEIEEAGEARMVKAIENLKEYMAKNTWYHPMYGSTFFNGGWHDYDIENETAELDTQPAKECENEEESYQ
jgi:phage replication O-like protein O